MASFENDFRFARPPDRASDGEDDEPIFGGADSFVEGGHQHAGPSNWRKRFRPAFDDEANDNLNGFPNGHATNTTEDAAFDESFQVGPARDENTELYAILNLDKDASTQDVLRSYRSLAVSFQ